MSIRLGRMVATAAAAVLVPLVSLPATTAHAAEAPPSEALVAEEELPAFYRAPATLPPANGDLIRSEPMRFTLDPAGGARIALTTTRVLYRSTDRTGDPHAVSGTVLVPKTPWIGPGRRPVIGYAAGTQGIGDTCAPSRQLSEGFEYESLFMAGMLARGWAVAMTDYEGLGTAGMHTYMDRESQGRAVLDALRAADTPISWFYLSPPPVFGAQAPGKPTGHYRLGDDEPVVTDDGESTISGADLAVALVDEIEKGAHHQARFTVGY